MDPIARFAQHVVSTGYEDLPEAALSATRTFLLDSLGVGIAGSAGPWVEELIACQQAWGTADDARAWVRGTRLPAPAAALVNAYQIHNSEFDCVHEAAVVHPMAVLLGATMAHAERAGDVGGRALLAALALGVDVACHIGVASDAGLRFFRPGTVGAFAATAAVGKLMGFDADRLVDSFGIVYSQACGTMQAHTEGTLLLAMQVGFNARNAIYACDMAARGLAGPQDVLEGTYGYYALFEGAHDLGPSLAALGSIWRITEVAHKPFPSGRATHGVLDGVMRLQREHGFAAGDVEHVTARVPPLTYQLVGREVMDAMTPNYARLCARYVMAVALLRGTVGVEDFRGGALHDPERLALARRIEVEADDNTDRNALTPVEVEVLLGGGARRAIALDVVYGNPARPMTREAHLAKFRGNCAAGSTPLPEAAAERLIALVEGLADEADVRVLVDEMIA
jgi:2-methylcitrate dehydratase PrpD